MGYQAGGGDLMVGMASEREKVRLTVDSDAWESAERRHHFGPEQRPVGEELRPAARRRWLDAIAGFSQFQKAADRSPGTIRLRRFTLWQLAEWVGCDPWTVTTDKLLAWMTDQAARLSADTRRSRLTTVRGFYRWAVDTGHTRFNPTVGLPTVTVPPGVPRPAPEPVYRAALATADSRKHLAVLLAAVCGLRCAEIAQVSSDDLVPGPGLVVHGKGRRERIVPLPDEVFDLLSECDGWAFPTPLKRGGPMRPGTITKWLSKELPGKWTGHTLRHRCGTVAYAGTRNIRAVQRLLGHARITTTERYVAVADTEVRAAMMAAAESPRR